MLLCNQNLAAVQNILLFCSTVQRIASQHGAVHLNTAQCISTQRSASWQSVCILTQLSAAKCKLQQSGKRSKLQSAARSAVLCSSNNMFLVSLYLKICFWRCFLCSGMVHTSTMSVADEIYTRTLIAKWVNTQWNLYLIGRPESCTMDGCISACPNDDWYISGCHIWNRYSDG